MGTNKWIAGGAALGFVAAGSLVLAGPGGAQEAQLEATIDPATVEQGGTVTIASVDPCLDDQGVPGKITVDIFFEDDAEPFQSDEFDLTPEDDPDGQWAVDYTGDPNEDLGTYTYLVSCFGDDDSLIGDYVPLSAETVAGSSTSQPPSSPTTQPEGSAPPPATPVVETPSLTG